MIVRGGIEEGALVGERTMPTLSGGIASFPSQAKNAGKDRVVVYESEGQPGG